MLLPLLGLKGLPLNRISVREGPEEEEVAACLSSQFRDCELLWVLMLQKQHVYRK